MPTPLPTATPDGFTCTDDYFAQEYMSFRDLMGKKSTGGTIADRAFSAIMKLWLNRPVDSRFPDTFIVSLTSEFQTRRDYMDPHRETVTPRYWCSKCHNPLPSPPPQCQGWACDMIVNGKYCDGLPTFSPELAAAGS